MSASNGRAAAVRTASMTGMVASSVGMAALIPPAQRHMACAIAAPTPNGRSQMSVSSRRAASIAPYEVRRLCPIELDNTTGNSKNTVALNLFQGPCAITRDKRAAGDRAWMLKQVQHDGVLAGAGSRIAVR